MKIQNKRLLLIPPFLITLLGMLVCVGWVFDIPILKSVLPGYSNIKFNTALLFIISGILFFLLLKKNTSLLYFVLTILLFVFPFLSIAQDVFNINLGLDQFFISDLEAIAVNHPNPGRIAPSTSFCFCLIAIAFSLLPAKRVFLQKKGQVLLHFTTLISLVAIIGYILNVPDFYSFNQLTSMAVGTSIGIFILSVTLSFIHPRLGFTGLLSGHEIGSIMARRLVPLLLIIVLILTTLRIVLHRRQMVDVEFGTALFALSFLMAGVFIIWNTALRLNKIDTKRLEAVAETQRINKSLEEKVNTRTAELQEVNQQISLFVKHTPAAVAMFDNELNYMVASNRWYTDYGLTGREIIGKNHYDVFPEIRKMPEWKAIHIRCLQGAVERKEDDFFTSADGSANWLKWEIHPWKKDNGTIGGIIMFTEVVTERKLAEQKLKQLNEQLTASNQELEKFAYVASHDLQEPLRMVSSFLHLLQKKYKSELDETANRYIHFAVDGADRMKLLIADLLNFSRVGTSAADFSEVPLNEIMQQIIQVFHSGIINAKAKIDFDSLPTVKGNATQLLQLFQNLIGNALKYKGPNQPTIIIGFSQTRTEWTFFVADNGIGIDERFFEKIFVIFQRLHNRDEYSGTGIGLAICKKIVERHGGKIWVQSRPGAGSTFYFTISKNI